MDTVSTHVFVIRHLIDNKRREVHASRLKFYQDASLNISTELQHHITSQGFTFDVSTLLDIRLNTSTRIYEVKVRWLGFEDDDISWEPFLRLLKDVPIMLLHFLEQFITTGSKSKALVKRLLKTQAVSKLFAKIAKRKHLFNAHSLFTTLGLATS